jgi:putative nucleotidyltransferase with HDIG domain
MHRVIGLVAFVILGILVLVLKLPVELLALGSLLLLPLVWEGGFGALGMAVALQLGLGLPAFFLPSYKPIAVLMAVVPSLLTLTMVAWLNRNNTKQPAKKTSSHEESLAQMQALEQGSMQISGTTDANALTEAVLETLAKFELATHTAFVRYRQGKPYVAGARGELQRYVGKVLPQQRLGAHASQSDSIAMGSYLEGIPESTGWSSAAVPVTGVMGQQKRPLGVLILARDGNSPFQPYEKAIANSLARIMGSQLGQMEALQQREEAFDQTLKAFGVLMEKSRSAGETQGHIQRVVTWADQIATELGLDAEKRRNLRWGAYLHDIGKLAIPESILSKPGKLTDEEWKIMRTHTNIGHEMMKQIPFLPEETLAVIRNHHESWDGSGYPDGLKATDIPLLARIFAVIDIFDALMSKRSYKEAWTASQIIAEFQNMKGKKLDPHLVDVFLRRLEARMAVASQQAKKEAVKT